MVVCVRGRDRQRGEHNKESADIGGRNKMKMQEVRAKRKIKIQVTRHSILIHASNPSTQETKAGRSLELETSLVYIVIRKAT